MADQVRLRRIQLQTYRNYDALRIDFSGAHAVFTGHNGAGKTNVLEAISLLSPGRGLRRAAYQDISNSRSAQTDGFTLHAQLECIEYGEALIGTGMAEGSAGEGGRRVRINGAPVSADTLLEYCRVVWLIPAMDGLFTGPASERRRFLDRMVLSVDPLHGRRVVNYEKAMRARNKLLNEGTADRIWLNALEAQLAELGVAIAAARCEIIRLLRTMVDRLLVQSLFPKAELELSGVLEELFDGGAAAIDVEEIFRSKLEEGRALDRAAGRTLEGPHRTDMSVFHAAKAMPAALCSTGEQKALLTGLILSHARLTAEMSQMTPLLLLDEISAHLDGDRRADLFNILDALGAQAFMTGTDRTLFSHLEGRAEFFVVEDGRITTAS